MSNRKNPSPAATAFLDTDPRMPEFVERDETLSTNQGVAISDNQNSLKTGPRGATLLEDFILREKITHFDHERIPERIVHARGSAAHGMFRVYESIDFVSLMPESTHMLMWAMSDRAIPRSYRMMQGFGVHSFKWANARDEVHFVKFHWKPLLGKHSLVWEGAQQIAGKDPDFHRRDLWEVPRHAAHPPRSKGPYRRSSVFTAARSRPAKSRAWRSVMRC